MSAAKSQTSAFAGCRATISRGVIEARPGNGRPSSRHGIEGRQSFEPPSLALHLAFELPRPCCTHRVSKLPRQAAGTRHEEPVRAKWN
ncbi:hypothetical protein BN1708_005443 [Verticillium longisporum]|uniref:Uncharacterized protein n=1 Tax=Verticillium longisporum TaxID=100787 RepID=A0A0G4MBD7_VERLO|nr:hypothetical protein BN1708_005443 [Verticillium longisporum]